MAYVFRRPHFFDPTRRLDVALFPTGNNASVAVTLPAITVAANGTNADIITGAVAATLQPITVAAVGDSGDVYTGSVAATIFAIEASAEGVYALNASSADVTLSAMTVSATGTSSPNATQVLLPAVTAIITGSFARVEIFCEIRRPDLETQCLVRPEGNPLPIRRAPECPDQFVCDCS